LLLNALKNGNQIQQCHISGNSRKTRLWPLWPLFFSNVMLAIAFFSQLIKSEWTQTKTLYEDEYYYHNIMQCYYLLIICLIEKLLTKRRMYILLHGSLFGPLIFFFTVILGLDSSKNFDDVYLLNFFFLLFALKINIHDLFRWKNFTFFINLEFVRWLCSTMLSCQ
jgi:hypothetical protein